MKISASTAPKILDGMKASGVLVSCRAYNGGGKVGQHCNRTLNAIEIVGEWNLDGEPLRLSASASLKSQHHSKAAALRILFSKLRAAVNARKEASLSKRMPAGFGGAGADRVRTYHQPDDRVNDESGFQATWRGTVGKNEIGGLVDERRRRRAVKGAA